MDSPSTKSGHAEKEYYKKKDTADGYQSICKQCQRTLKNQIA